MTLVRSLVIAVTATALAAAVFGAATASAADEVVLCKQLVEKGSLCPDGKLWPKGSIVEALAERPLFETAFFEFYCEDSVLKAKTTAEMGASLPLEVTRIDFGVLPTPELGKGCPVCSGVHAALSSASLGVEGVDAFFLEISGTLKFSGCSPLAPLGCNYGISTKATITHTGTHSGHESSNLPAIEIKKVLLKKNGGICYDLQLSATYVVTLVTWGEEKGLGWPALDL